MANATAYQTAVDFIPMAGGLIIASALTGPWVARIGPRIPMTVGCLLAGTGILLTSVVLGPHVNFGTLGWDYPSPVSVSGSPSWIQVIAKIATKVVNAAYEAFGSGLHLALEISGALLLLGAVVAVLTIHRTAGQTYDF